MILLLMMTAAAPACHALDHGRILGSDLSAASALFSALPPDVVIGNAPLPGARRLFEPAELIRVARTNHIEITGMSPLCFERTTAPLDPELVRAAMEKSLGDTPARIQVLAVSKYPAPKGDLVFPRASLMQPTVGNSAVWYGHVVYDGGSFPVWARVQITIRQSRLVSSVKLTPGHTIEAGDVRVEEGDSFPRLTEPLAAIEAAVGQVVRRAIPAGSVLIATMLQAPYDVERGQNVIVEVNSGKAVIKLEGRAESTGRRGEMVNVRNVDSGSLFRAQVESKGRVLVICRSQSEDSQ